MAGVFAGDEKVRLSAEHLQICVGSLEEWKLFNSNLDVIDDAFEYLVNKASKGEKGQYFTPRWVIDMCVKMLNPKEDESVIDPAAGSAGFTVHTMFYVWQKVLKALGLPASHMFTMERKPPRCEDYVRDNVFAIDFDEKSVRVARCLNLIAGDGETNVLHLNSLDWKHWIETSKDDDWNDTFSEGWKRLKRKRSGPDDRNYGFDLVMANPPFAGDIKQSAILAPYDLAHDENGRMEKAVPRDLLFIERNLDLLRPGGRMAIVLPQSRFNNRSNKYIRKFIMDRCRVLGVVGLHPNSFKPHTGTRTSVIIVQKWNDDEAAGVICKRIDDYNIFFATQQLPSKDNSGEKIYRKQASGQFARDEHGHFIVEHDLFAHGEFDESGIAEAFVEFANLEGLSFAPGFPSTEKFREIADRIEVYVVPTSKLQTDLRLDAQYYMKKYLCDEDLIEARNPSSIGEIAFVTDGPHGYHEVEPGSPIAMLTAKSVTQWYATRDGSDPISARTNRNNARSILTEGDVLLSTRGTVGASAIVTRDCLPANIDQDVARIALNDPSQWLPQYVTAYINSKFGQDYIARNASGAVQQGMSLQAVRAMPIPTASQEIQKKVRDIVEAAREARKLAERLLALATEAVETAIVSGESSAMILLEGALQVSRKGLGRAD
jgi:type I restriction enzyme M protein